MWPTGPSAIALDYLQWPWLAVVGVLVYNIMFFVVSTLETLF